MRTVSVGPFDGATAARVSVWPSRSLIWAATGERYERSAVSYDLPPFTDFPLAATDQPGWIDAKTGSIIDVSSPDSHAFTYTMRIQLWRGGTRIRNYQVGPFVVPAGSTVIDLDTLTEAPNTPGVLVPGGLDPAVVSEAVQDAITALGMYSAAQTDALLNAHVTSERPHQNAESGKSFAAWFNAQIA